MKFDWDEKKNASNIRKHGVDFVTAAQVFDDLHQLQLLDRVVDGEVRWKTMGIVDSVLLLIVVHTVHDDFNEEYYRIISARHALPHERRRYEEDV